MKIAMKVSINPVMLYVVSQDVHKVSMAVASVVTDSFYEVPSRIVKLHFVPHLLFRSCSYLLKTQKIVFWLQPSHLRSVQCCSASTAGSFKSAWFLNTNVCMLFNFVLKININVLFLCIMFFIFYFFQYKKTAYKNVVSTASGSWSNIGH